MENEEINATKEETKQEQFMNKYLDSLHEKILASDFSSQVSENEIMALVQAKEAFASNTCTYIGACEHNKRQALDKIKAEIMAMTDNIDTVDGALYIIAAIADVLDIIDKYIEEDEE